jgi:5-formyltetrahydrofolate cyclo-ligase
MDDKQAYRDRIWRILEKEGVARFPGTRGRIPNFIGAERAAGRLAETDEWRGARTIKSNPDAPQLPVRAAALGEGRILYMAVPRLRDTKPFLLLDPKKLAGSPRSNASIKGAARAGRKVTVKQMRHIDLVVCGSVAVNRKGARIGKGGGFSDLELGLLVEAGMIDDDTVVATTVHDLQVLDEDLPETGHDFRVDLISTPEEVIRVRRRRRRPPGIVWADLEDEKIAEVPVLRSLSRSSLRSFRRSGDKMG